MSSIRVQTFSRIDFRFSDLRNWGGHTKTLEARLGGWRDANKIGISPPLIQTTEGWLLIDYGGKHNAFGVIYRLGLALFDLTDPDFQGDVFSASH